MRLGTRRGSSLLEVLVAVGLFGAALALLGGLAQDFLRFSRHNDLSEEPRRLAQECLARMRADLGCAVTTVLSAGNSVLTVHEIDPAAVRFPTTAVWSPDTGGVDVVYQVSPQGLTRRQGSASPELLGPAVRALALQNLADGELQISLSLAVLHGSARATETTGTRVFVPTRFL